MFAFHFSKQTGSTASAEKARHQQTRLVFGTAAPPQPSPASKQLKMDVKTSDKSAVNPRNLMDSSAPKTMRGKEKEGPKKKKPSSLRKVTRQHLQEVLLCVTMIVCVCSFPNPRLSRKRRRKRKDCESWENPFQRSTTLCLSFLSLLL